MSYIITTKPKFQFRKSNIPIWMAVANDELGQSEIKGEEDNPRIVEYLKAVGLGTGESSNDEIAWCSAFVNWVFKECGYSNTGSGLARSWLEWGEELSEPRYGCVCILERGTEPWQGHVALFLDHPKPYVQLLGGNQGNRVGVNAYTDDRVLGYRWPKL